MKYLIEVKHEIVLWRPTPIMQCQKKITNNEYVNEMVVSESK